MSLIDFLKSRLFFKHLLLAIVLTIVIVYLIIFSLSFYTHHGEFYTVPDFRGKQPDELKVYAEENGFDFVVVDSLYDAKLPKGSVILQDPLPNSKVKHSRTMYLTVVSSEPEKVSMPNLIDLSLRQTISLLETYGLQIGSLEYIPDMAKNAVLKQKYKGVEIETGKPIRKGSKIDLVLGQGTGGDKMTVPFLLGKKQSEVMKILRASSLNIGTEVFEDSKDTVHARVYKQSPAYGAGRLINMGQSINVWYRSDKKVNFNELIKNYKYDSTANESDNF
ncbi:MAG: PASTA domain-containing protein [Bacteroidetes bacterium]|nr:PASTA domain-containing protein [Bacteroidota bacterium]